MADIFKNLVDWVVLNQVWLKIVAWVILPIIIIVLGIVLEQLYHKKMIGTDAIEKKCGYKDNQRLYHMITLLFWIVLCVVNLSNLQLPNMEWWQCLIVMSSLYVLPLADAWLTFKAIGNNYNKEVNPIGRFIMERWGRKGVYIYSGIIWMLASGFFSYMAWASDIPWNVPLIFISMYIGVYASNVLVFYRMRKYPDLYWYTEWYDGKKVSEPNW